MTGTTPFQKETLAIAALEEIRRTNGSAALRFTRDGRWLVLSGGNSNECLETGTWRTVSRVSQEPSVAALALSDDSRWAATRQGPLHVQLCEIPSLRPILTLDAGWDMPECFSPDGSLLLTRRDGGRFCVWDLRLMRAELAKLGLGW